MERRCLRMGAAAIGCAVLLRLAGGGAFDPLLQTLQQPETAAFLLYLETGRAVRPVKAAQLTPGDPEDPPPDTTAAAVPETTAPEVTEPPATEETVPPAAVFSPGDGDLVEVKCRYSYQPDLEALLQAPLDWQLRGEAPTVLILHTHATESYTKTGEDYPESAAYRTLETDYNMVSIGDRLAERLEAGGVKVIHDRSLHDYPSYNGSYADARESTTQYLAQYPSIRLVLDIHRDAAEDANGHQVAQLTQIQGVDTARMMLVLGSSLGSYDLPQWEENLALAVKLQAQLEKQFPGLCRPLNITGQRYNQDLLPGALLIEVGSAGNTRAQALAAAEDLAQGILALASGCG